MFTLDDDILRQLRATFKIEAAEHIQAINRILLALEKNPQGAERQTLMDEIFREAHSLKGAAGAADFGEVESTAHKLESIFGAAKSGKLTLTRDLCDVLYAGVDAVSVIVDAALEEKPHGLDLAQLHAQLAAAEQGQVVATAKPAPRIETVTQPPDAVPQEFTAVHQPPVAAPTPPPPPPPEPKPVVAPAPAPEPADAPEPEPARPQPPAVRAVVDNKPDYKGDDRRRRTGSAIEDTIRVATSKVDSLMTQAGELLVAGLKIDQRLNEVQQIGTTVDEWNREWLDTRAANSSLLHDAERENLRPLIKLLDMNQERLRTLAAQVTELMRGFSGDALHLARITNDLGESVMKVRMLPVSTVFDAFPRLVRDLARDSNKEIEIVMEGTETELDRKMLEEIKDPLIHLLRNAVDHGIEKPKDRVQAGKPRQGTISVKAFQKGNNIVIEVADDGGGINRNKVKQAALKNGVITADEMHAMSDDEALRLIFAAGLSTAPMITDISGRGVGMDVVRRNVEALHGQVDIESTLGVGTTITLTLPLTLATTQELLVQVGDQTYGIPISAVERIHRIQAKDISAVQGRQAILVDDEPVSLVRLAQVLERPATEVKADADDKVPTVILGSARKRIAFLVDAVLGQQETVVKSLGKQLARVRNVAGATILGTGQVIMTLNPTDLMKSARGMEGRASIAAQPHANAATNGKPKERRVLVVDDSLSTRTLEKNILETAGYKVQVATDGMEAMSVLNSNGGFDVIVSDVLMPRMTGFELTAAVKADPKLKKIPVVLVTSLDSRADKEHGIEVGADAYLVKSNFDQANLLQTIAQLV
ncbi:MAG: hybrid sensor histidine kinase/response regulator [Chloroflexi bacterium]|nr:hybrid sensor histidine kinase/response regulator [Chloroflexota bacterium]